MSGMAPATRRPLLLCSTLLCLSLVHTVAAQGKGIAECPTNPTTQHKCSMTQTVVDSSMEAKKAGVCDPSTGTCTCSDVSAGLACDQLLFASSRSRLDAPGDLWFNSWRFLSKSCWGAKSTGSLVMTLRFNYFNCSAAYGGTCVLDNPPIWTAAKLPKILFYADYGSTFSRAVLFSSKIESGQTTDASSFPECDGVGAVFQEPMRCDPDPDAIPVEEGQPHPACTMTKTYNVLNHNPRQSLVYLAVSNCGLSGAVSWDVEVKYGVSLAKTGTKDDPVAALQQTAVCGARGSRLEMRCFSEAGGSCGVQEPMLVYQAIKPNPGKMSKTFIAVVCVVFAAVAGALFIALKSYQRHVKTQRAKEILSRVGFNNRYTNGEGDEMEETEGWRAHTPMYPQQSLSVTTSQDPGMYPSIGNSP